MCLPNAFSIQINITVSLPTILICRFLPEIHEEHFFCGEESNHCQLSCQASIFLKESVQVVLEAVTFAVLFDMKVMLCQCNHSLHPP